MTNRILSKICMHRHTVNMFVNNKIYQYRTCQLVKRTGLGCLIHTFYLYQLKLYTMLQSFKGSSCTKSLTTACQIFTIANFWVMKVLVDYNLQCSIVGSLELFFVQHYVIHQVNSIRMWCFSFSLCLFT